MKAIKESIDNVHSFHYFSILFVLSLVINAEVIDLFLQIL